MPELPRFDDQRITQALSQLLLMKQTNERLMQAVQKLTTTMNEAAHAGRLVVASLTEMNRVLQEWPFKRRLPRRAKKALAKLDARVPLTLRERRIAERLIASGNVTIERLRGTGQ